MRGTGSRSISPLLILKNMESYEITIKKGLFEDKVRADFKKDYFLSAHHFELHGKATSETGYKSLFVMKEEMKGKTTEEFLKENLEVDFGSGNVEVKKIN